MAEELKELAEELDDQDDESLEEPSIRHTEEEWDEIEANDDYLIQSGDIAAEISYFQSGKPYLSINAVMRLANHMNLDIDEIQVEETKRNTYRIMAKAVSPRGKRRWGFHEEQINLKDHSFSKAGNKAQRNAFRNFIYGHKNADAAIKAFLESNSNGQQAQQTRQPAQQQAQQAPPPQQETALPVSEAAPQPTEIDIARAKVNDAVKELLPDFETKHQIVAQMFWERVKVRYGRTESKYFTKDDWNDLYEQIHMDPLPDWLTTPVSSETQAAA